MADEKLCERIARRLLKNDRRDGLTPDQLTARLDWEEEALPGEAWRVALVLDALAEEFPVVKGEWRGIEFRNTSEI